MGNKKAKSSTIEIFGRGVSIGVLPINSAEFTRTTQKGLTDEEYDELISSAEIDYDGLYPDDIVVSVCGSAYLCPWESIKNNLIGGMPRLESIYANSRDGEYLLIRMEGYKWSGKMTDIANFSPKNLFFEIERIQISPNDEVFLATVTYDDEEFGDYCENIKWTDSFIIDGHGNRYEIAVIDQENG